jgi:DNA-binding transcriptional ArsR family regulator
MPNTGITDVQSEPWHYLRVSAALTAPKTCDGPPPNSASSDGAIWGATNDESRRKILDLLRRTSMTTGEICTHLEFSRFAVMKHLNILEKSGLVIVERRGRERMNHLNPVPLQQIYRRWIKPFEQISADRMLRLKALVENQKEH